MDNFDVNEYFNKLLKADPGQDAIEDEKYFDEVDKKIFITLINNRCSNFRINRLLLVDLHDLTLAIYGLSNAVNKQDIRNRLINMMSTSLYRKTSEEVAIRSVFDSLSFQEDNEKENVIVHVTPNLYLKIIELEEQNDKGGNLELSFKESLWKFIME